jgi:hypothetical protein
MLVAYLLIASIQSWYWWNDLRQRCPVCLDRLVLPVTWGTANRVLLGSAITNLCERTAMAYELKAGGHGDSGPQEGSFLGVGSPIAAFVAASLMRAAR